MQWPLLVGKITRIFYHLFRCKINWDCVLWIIFIRIFQQLIKYEKSGSDSTETFNKKVQSKKLHIRTFYQIYCIKCVGKANSRQWFNNDCYYDGSSFIFALGRVTGGCGARCGAGGGRVWGMTHVQKLVPLSPVMRLLTVLGDKLWRSWSNEELRAGAARVSAVCVPLCARINCFEFKRLVIKFCEPVSLLINVRTALLFWNAFTSILLLSRFN